MIGHLKEMRADAELPKAKEQHWMQELGLLEQQLGNMPPAPESYQQWKESLDETKARMQQDIVEAATAKSADVATRGLVRRSAEEQLILNRKLPPGPSITSVFQPEQVSQARRNLKVFNWVSRTVAIALLAWLGMTELYGSNPTFGAEPLRDYLALLAWGFGAELTRESVVSATQSLGLPLTK